MTDAVRLLSTLALQGAFARLGAQFEAVRGIQVAADFAPTVALLPRLRGGEPADLVILTREGLDQLAEEGRVVAKSRTDLARSYVGVAVKAGMPHPDIATPEALRASLLAARSVAYSRIGASGIYFAQLITQLGIAADINAKGTIVAAGLTAERLISGEADIAIQQISELKQVEGIDVVGPIPPALQTPSVFSAGLMADARRPVEAERLLRYLASAEVAPVLRESGLEP